jgi:metal-responsive CopG/Arc/MetJ family transcriptional regulator
MKTIAITIDQATLERVDRLGVGRSRSGLIRDAVREYVGRLERLAEEEREAAVIHRNRGRLARQAHALARAQAQP